MRENKPVDLSAVVSRLTRQFARLEAQTLKRYLDEILAWNDQVGVVSKRSTPDVLERLVRDSAQLYEFAIGYGKRNAALDRPNIVDIGSGGGFPGLIWKLLNPGISLVLLERKQKKATFLERTVRVLGVDGVEVVEADARVALTLERFDGRFDLVVATAVGPPAAVGPLGERFLRPAGYFCTVVPREVTTPAERIGKRLKLARTAPGDHNIFCLYELQEEHRHGQE